MENQTTIAAAAGLLHDIGKFAIRAAVGASRIWDDLASKEFGHKHALLTDDFIEKSVPSRWKTDLRRAAAQHHRPQNRLDYCVTLADHLSAGERADPTDDSRAAQPMQMVSIFSSLEIEGEGKLSEDVYLPLAELEIKEDVLFPIPQSPRALVEKAYETLWDDFVKEAAALGVAFKTEGSLSLYIEGLMLLMQRYTWCMPSAYYKSRPDISLYDHDRMTGALAAILVGSELDQAGLAKLSSSAELSGEPIALLVGGDISGVQDFIYTISSRGAASALRGRSFYLQLLSEALYRYILQELDLPATNLIYCGGGNFYLLVRVQDQEKLKSIQAAISRILSRHYHGDLYLALAAIPLASSEFYKGRISEKWEQLGGLLQEVKKRRFAELGDDLDKLFMAHGHGGNEEKLCQVCGREHPKTKADKKPDESDEEAVKKCPNCLAFEDLGDRLRKARFLSLGMIPKSQPAEWSSDEEGRDWNEVLAELGLKADVGEEISKLDITSPGIVLALSKDGLEELTRSIRPGVVVGRRLMVNVTPILNGSVKPFEVMAVQSHGIQRLGVARMDIDNLGQLFSKGLGNYATLSRVASLSMAISLFTEGWVARIAQDLSDQGSDCLYSIYSGGDDLFFVGAWNQVIELMRLVRVDLGRYTAHHPGLHASAGIVLVPPKYPLSQAAQDAGRAEDRAKGLVWRDPSSTLSRKKDAVDFLGQTLPWCTFGLEENCDQTGMDTAHALFHWLVGQEGNVDSRPLVRRLTDLYSLYSEAARKRADAGVDLRQDGKPQALFGPWNWLAEYSLRKATGAEMLRRRIRETDFESIDWIGLAARWADLYNRG